MPMNPEDKPSWRQRFVEAIAKVLRVPLYTWPYVIVIDNRDIERAQAAAEDEEGRERMH